MTKIKQLQKFIKDNGLQFTEGRRNSDLVVLCGYALYVEATDEDVWDSIPEIGKTPDVNSELDRVWSYAQTNNYGSWWETEANRKAYKL